MFKPSRVLFSLFAAMLAAIPVYGQINWRPINPQELALKIPMVDKDADAEAIFWNIWMDDSQPDKTIFRHYLRVKVFTARGVESQSRVDLTHFGKDKITDIFARTIKADGSILDLKKDAILERALIKQGRRSINRSLLSCRASSPEPLSNTNGSRSARCPLNTCAWTFNVRFRRGR